MILFSYLPLQLQCKQSYVAENNLSDSHFVSMVSCPLPSLPSDCPGLVTVQTGQMPPHCANKRPTHMCLDLMKTQL